MVQQMSSENSISFMFLVFRLISVDVCSCILRINERDPIQYSNSVNYPHLVRVCAVCVGLDGKSVIVRNVCGAYDALWPMICSQFA